jgi:GTP cyclohydrolase II
MSPTEVARVELPTSFGSFDLRAFQSSEGTMHLALIAGGIGDGTSLLTRIHSECLTGDTLGSLRCDCGVQLKGALQAIRAEGRGMLLYVTGHEGRGIGLVDKLRAYLEQDAGADTVDANLHLGLPVDNRSFGTAAEVLKQLSVRSIRLLTNNPNKLKELLAGGIEVEAVRGIPVAANGRTLGYLQTKRDRLNHGSPLGPPLEEVSAHLRDVSSLIGDARPRVTRPWVVLKYAQSIDGRIATASGDSRWISGSQERAIAHALRARCDAVMVGVGTVLSDDPQLTVRLVPGPSPTRVILDSSLRAPSSSKVFDGSAPTIVITTERSAPKRRAELRTRDIAVHLVPSGPGGVDTTAALALLRQLGVSTLLVEGGRRLITSLVRARCADRIVVAVAPILLGQGIEAVGDLGVKLVNERVSLINRSVASPPRGSVKLAISFNTNRIKVGCGRPCRVATRITDGYPISFTKVVPSRK